MVSGNRAGSAALKNRPLLHIHNLPEEEQQKGAGILMEIYANSAMMEKNDKQGQP